MKMDVYKYFIKLLLDFEGNNCELNIAKNLTNQLY